MKTKDNTIKRKLKSAYYRAIGYYPTSINGYKFRFDPDHFPFWRRVAKGKWEPHTYEIMDRFIGSNSTVCDIGAWIGPTVVYAARKCNRVICFEPDRVAYKYLNWNIELNELHNVTPFCIALADRTAIQKMSSFGGKLGDTMTSLLHDGKDENRVDALTLSWETFINLSGIGKIDYIKIDIEGAEFALLPTMKDYLSVHKPIVYLSTHAPMVDVRLRKEKMRHLMDVMGIYKQCFDVNLRPVDIGELQGKDAMNSYPAYVFMD